MAKKIYDIIPLKVKAENTARDLEKNKVKKIRKKPITKKESLDIVIPQPESKATKAPVEKNNKRRLNIKGIAIAGLIVFSVLGIYLYNKLPKVDIQIWPTTETITFQDKIVADRSVKAIDFDKKIIPAQYIEIQKEETQEFLATSTASNDVKASGTIRIYNKINPVTKFTLITGTHFLSDSGKYFVTLQKVTIPAAKYEKGKLVAGYIDVKVQAEQVGVEYNIKASKFSVPKLYGNPAYYSIWADSSSPMTGGYVGQVKKVSKSDIAQAKETLSKKLLSEIESSIKSNLASGDVLLDNAIIKNIVSASSDVKADSIAEKFNESVKVEVLVLVFKKQDLESFSKDYILSKATNDQTLLEESLNFDYTPKEVDVNEGKISLDLKSAAKIYQNVQINDLIDFVSLKSADQIKETINRMYSNNVSDIKIKFWPFWVNSSPKDKDRIKVDVLFE